MGRLKLREIKKTYPRLHTLSVLELPASAHSHRLTVTSVWHGCCGIPRAEHLQGTLGPRKKY